MIISKPTISNRVQTTNIKNLDIEFSLSIPGEHNVLNACGSLIMLDVLSKRLNKILDFEIAKETLLKFKNTKRRFEKTGECNGAIILDDYAHHPKEIEVTLKSAKEFYKDRKITVVFQSHTFSRTQSLEKDFTKCFSGADKVIIAPIYPSAREKKTNYTSKDFHQAISQSHQNALYFDTYEEITKHLKETISREDIVITMGAGDIWQTTVDL